MGYYRGSPDQPFPADLGDLFSPHPFPPHHRGIQSLMQKIALLPASLMVALCLTLSGCGNFLTVYKADLNQGNVVTRDMVDKLKIGMTPSQVRYVLGTPLITDTLNPKRWDYLYDYVPGTYARKAHLADIKNRHFTVYFENGVLAKMEGTEQIPASNPEAPESKDKTLTADPL
jgi:outer membrane protein assembly factor BamE